VLPISQHVRQFSAPSFPPGASRVQALGAKLDQKVAEKLIFAHFLLQNRQRRRFSKIIFTKNK